MAAVGWKVAIHAHERHHSEGFSVEEVATNMISRTPIVVAIAALAFVAGSVAIPHSKAASSPDNAPKSLLALQSRSVASRPGRLKPRVDCDPTEFVASCEAHRKIQGFDVIIGGGEVSGTSCVGNPQRRGDGIITDSYPDYMTAICVGRISQP